MICRVLPLLLLWSLAFPGQVFARGTRQALLIGVTKYPNLAASLQLEGGANDVLLIKRVLMEKFGFAPDDIVILSEAEGARDARMLPTRPNIERECKALAARLSRDGQALVLLSGHGSRQPEKEGAKDPQPDGFDKIFLPRDVSKFDLSDGAVPNAITGRELGNWLRAIPQKKARLWMIVDACHSGEMVRGADEKARQVKALDLGIPAKLVEAAENRAAKRAAKAGEKSRDPAGAVPYHGPLGREPGVVLTYACLSRQTTLEGHYPDPYGKGERKPFGLFSHTMAGILISADADLSYRELMTRTINAYTSLGKEGYTPVIEGAGQGRTVLGSKAVTRSSFVLTDRDDALVVNAGQLHGITTGTILAVFPPPGKKGEKRGHVRVVTVSPARCEVKPVKHAGMPAPAIEKILGGRCEVSEVAYGDLRLKVAVEAGKLSKEKHAELSKLVASLGKQKDSPIRHVEDAAGADWLVRLEGGRLRLLPASEAKDERRSRGRALGPPPEGEDPAEWLEDACRRVVRASNLKRIALGKVDERLRGGGDDVRPRAELEVVGADGEALKGDAARTFYHGDRVRLRVRNAGKVPLDVTVLYIDSQFGIAALFPTRRGGEANRIEPGKSLMLGKIDVNGETSGREDIVVIAVKSRGDELADFAALEQKSIFQLRGDARKRGSSQRGLESAFGKVLQKAMYGEGATRGMRASEIEEFAARVVPVRVIGTKRPARD